MSPLQYVLSPLQYVMSPLQYIKREKWVDVLSVSWQKKIICLVRFDLGVVDVFP